MINKRGFLQTVAGFFAGASTVTTAKAETTPQRKEGELWAEHIKWERLQTAHILSDIFAIKTIVGGKEVVILTVSADPNSLGHQQRVVEYVQNKREHYFGD